MNVLDIPNAGAGLKTLPKRMKWDEEFRKYLKELDTKKPVVLTGDLNVAHEEIGIILLTFVSIFILNYCLSAQFYD